MPGKGFRLDADLPGKVHRPFHQINTAIDHISGIFNFGNKDGGFIENVIIHGKRIATGQHGNSQQTAVEPGIADHYSVTHGKGDQGFRHE